MSQTIEHKYLADFQPWNFTSTLMTVIFNWAAVFGLAAVVGMGLRLGWGQ